MKVWTGFIWLKIEISGGLLGIYYCHVLGVCVTVGGVSDYWIY
jgi:hypothetical protein